jgi:60 kDa SS-A/Ro ribonucleoprotein
MDTLLYALAFCTRVTNDALILPHATIRTTTSNADAVRKAAFKVVSVVCTTPSMLYQFVAYHTSLGTSRGQGRGFRRAISHWFTSKNPKQLAFILSKGGKSHGWSARDLIRVSHVHVNPAESPATSLVVEFFSKGVSAFDAPNLPDDEVFMDTRHFLLAYHTIQTCTSVPTAITAIHGHRLCWEHLPTPLLADAKIWAALVERMSIGALIRNLGRLGKLGLLEKGSATAVYTAHRLVNEVAIKVARLHPLTALIAHEQYRIGHGDKGKNTWQVEPDIVTALHSTMQLAFAQCVPLGEDTPVIIGLDVSGSMMTTLPGIPISAETAAAALVMTMLRTASSTTVVAFSSDATILNLDKTSSLQMIIEQGRTFPYCMTDCALPIIAATRTMKPARAFVVITDNDTNCGRLSCEDALKMYNGLMGYTGYRRAKLIVLSLAGGGKAIAVPGHTDMLDIAGFDANTANLVSAFITGGTK